MMALLSWRLVPVPVFQSCCQLLSLLRGSRTVFELERTAVSLEWLAFVSFDFGVYLDCSHGLSRCLTELPYVILSTQGSHLKFRSTLCWLVVIVSSWSPVCLKLLLPIPRVPRTPIGPSTSSPMFALSPLWRSHGYRGIEMTLGSSSRVWGFVTDTVLVPGAL